jgi:tRNA-dihydrouridine synthase 1
VFANGNIIYHEHLQECLDYTGADGVMTAEGNLNNPAIFTNINYSCMKLAKEYLDICIHVPNSATISNAKSHLFKMFHKLLPEHPEIRESLGRVKSFTDLSAILERLKDAIGDVPDVYALKVERDERNLKILPSWVLQPHVRPEESVILKKMGLDCNPAKRKKEKKLKHLQTHSKDGKKLEETIVEHDEKLSLIHI